MLGDFSRPKIVYPDIMRLPRTEAALQKYPYFSIDTNGYIPEATVFMMSGDGIEDICKFLCSEIGFFIYTKFYMGPVFDNTGFRYKKEYILQLPIPKVSFYDSCCYEVELSKYLGLTEDEMKIIEVYKRSLIVI